MAAIGRHTTSDFYGCRRGSAQQYGFIARHVIDGHPCRQLENAKYSKLPVFPEGITVVALLTDGHLAIHTYPEVGFAAIDIFTCDSHSMPEKALTAIKCTLVPEKTKNTLIKRGDFGSERDMKPRTKTHSGPIRKVRDTGTKVLKFYPTNKFSKQPLLDNFSIMDNNNP